MFTIKEIGDKSYIKILNGMIKSDTTLGKLIETAHIACPELKQYCQENRNKFKSATKDKGIVGKIFEFELFGKLPNNDSRPDTLYGDIKTTHFKRMVNGLNAKERLTLTNFGDPIQNFDLLSDKKTIEETKYYEKIRTGIILVLLHDNQPIYDKKIITILHYDLNEIFKMHDDVKKVFEEDFEKIKKCVIEKNPTQRGQKYLHLHKHGCKNSITRAFGFTNKFLTKLVALHLNVPLITNGKSEYITEAPFFMETFRNTRP